tara:strand:- start:77 stop:493 length:417 start_codon:yes stop_codon:yes gene_type:complete
MVKLFNFKSIENFSATTHEIVFNEIKDYGTLNITTGDTVIWTHDNDHSVNITPFFQSSMNHNWIHHGTSITFSQSGHFIYICGIHGSSMKGKIVVTDRPITTLSIIIPIFFFFTIFGIALGLYMYFRRKGTSSTPILD